MLGQFASTPTNPRECRHVKNGPHRNRRDCHDPNAGQHTDGRRDRQAGCVLAGRQLSVSRANLSVRQPPPEGAAEGGTRQAQAARPLGHNSRPQLHLRAPQSPHQEKRPVGAVHRGPGPRRARTGGKHVPRRHVQRALHGRLAGRGGNEASLQAVLISRRHPEPRRTGDAGLDPRRRGARLQLVARVRCGLRQPRTARCMRDWRRRGRNRTACDQLALEQVPQPGNRRRRAADPPPERLQDRKPERAGADSARRAGFAAPRVRVSALRRRGRPRSTPSSTRFGASSSRRAKPDRRRAHDGRR
jgi:hypothetical protein